METEYSVSEKDFINAIRLNWRRVICVKVKWLLLILSALFVVSILFPSYRMLLIDIAFLLYCMILFITVLVRASSWALRRRYKKTGVYFREKIQIRLEDSGVRLTQSDGEYLLRWEKLHKWQQNKHVLLIYLDPKVMYIIPKSIADSGFDVTALVEALREKVGEESKK